jgi:hypothetical protein
LFTFKQKNMRQLTLLLILLLSAQATLCAQENALKVNLINPLLFKKWTFAYERAITPQSSLQLNVNYLNASFSAKLNSGESAQVSGRSLGFTPEYRYYISENQGALRGFYVAGYGNFARTSADAEVNGGSPETTGSGDARGFFVGLGGMIGYQFMVSDVFIIDLFGGIGGVYGQFNDVRLNYLDESFEDIDVSQFPVAGVWPRVGFVLGFAF